MTANHSRLGVLEALPTAVVVVSADETIRYANERATDILGLQSTQLVGRTVGDVLGSEMLGADLLREERRGERTFELSCGQEQTIGYTSAPLGTQGDTVLVFQDITPFAKLRYERDRLMRMAAIGEALPSLLHELKTPLAAVTAAVEVLIEEVEEVEDGEVAAQLHAVLSELRRMALGFDGIGAVHRELRSSRHAAVDYACREACRVLEPRARGAGLHLRWSVADLPLLPLDPSVVRAIVFNFVTNAIHACERGGTIHLSVRLKSRQSRFELSVVDTGVGMPPAVLEKATDLFFTTKPSGIGIGLALCRRAVEGAGGEMTLKSVPGFGTSVFVSVPVERPGTKARK